MLDLIKLIADVGGSLGLALFAIWISERTYRDYRERVEQDRAELLAAMERNTAAWAAVTEKLAELGKVIEGGTEMAGENARTLARLTAIMARRPCIATGVLDE